MPFVLSLSKDRVRRWACFDKLSTNGNYDIAGRFDPSHIPILRPDETETKLGKSSLKSPVVEPKVRRKRKIGRLYAISTRQLTIIEDTRPRL